MADLEPEVASIGISTDETAAQEVQALTDAEHGFPRRCKCRDGAEPWPGVPCTIDHAFGVTPITDADDLPVAYYTPLPTAELDEKLLEKIDKKTEKEIEKIEEDAKEPKDDKEAKDVK